MISGAPGLHADLSFGTEVYISFPNYATAKLLPNYQTLCKVNSPFILRNLVFVVSVCESLDILISEWRYNKGGHQTFHKFN